MKIHRLPLPAFIVLASMTITACNDDKGTRPGEGPPEQPKQVPNTPGNINDPGRAGSGNSSTGGPTSGGVGSPSK